MAWSTPRTWVTGETVTAALMNAHIRDQLRETSPFTVTTAGDLSYADAANSMNSRLAIGAAHGMLVSTGTAPVWRIPATDSRLTATTGLGSGTSYTDLGSVAWYNDSDDVEVTVTTGTAALVLFESSLTNDTLGEITYLSYSISGATTRVASDNYAIYLESNPADNVARFSGFELVTVTAGSNTFTLEARVGGGAGTIQRPSIAVLPL